MTTDGDFLIFEGNRYSRQGFLFKNFPVTAIVSDAPLTVIVSDAIPFITNQTTINVSLLQMLLFLIVFYRLQMASSRHWLS